MWILYILFTLVCCFVTYKITTFVMSKCVLEHIEITDKKIDFIGEQIKNIYSIIQDKV